MSSYARPSMSFPQRKCVSVESIEGRFKKYKPYMDGFKKHRFHTFAHLLPQG